jgi:hypothetical protein
VLIIVAIFSLASITNSPYICSQQFLNTVGSGRHLYQLRRHVFSSASIAIDMIAYFHYCKCYK